MKYTNGETMSLSEFFSQFEAPRGRATFTKVPMRYLDLFKMYAESRQYKFRIRYRGPRNTILDMRRSRDNRASTCLKANAVTFSAYRNYGG